MQRFCKMLNENTYEVSARKRCNLHAIPGLHQGQCSHWASRGSSPLTFFKDMVGILAN